MQRDRRTQGARTTMTCSAFALLALAACHKKDPAEEQKAREVMDRVAHTLVEAMVCDVDAGDCCDAPDAGGCRRAFARLHDECERGNGDACFREGSLTAMDTEHPERSKERFARGCKLGSADACGSASER